MIALLHCLKAVFRVPQRKREGEISQTEPSSCPEMRTQKLEYQDSKVARIQNIVQEKTEKEICRDVNLQQWVVHLFVYLWVETTQSHGKNHQKVVANQFPALTLVYKQLCSQQNIVAIPSLGGWGGDSRRHFMTWQVGGLISKKENVLLSLSLFTTSPVLKQKR